MFKPVSLLDSPLKEGRLPVAAPSTREASAKRAQRIRHIILGVLVLLLLRTLQVLYLSPSEDLPPRGLEPAPRASAHPTPAAPETSPAFPKLDVDGPEGRPLLSLENSGKPGQVPIVDGHDGARDETKTGLRQDKFAPRPGFDQALADIINLLPSELEIRGLFRPIEMTGEQRIRELGLLARRYKKYYEAWEALHVVTDAEGATHVRDDVIQYLRAREAAASAAASPGDEREEEHGRLVERIHAYEDFRRLLVRLNEQLFPFTAPYFPDHMTMRSHLRRGGRGIVLTAGNDQVAYLLTQIPILRRLGCRLPVEVMYNGDGDLNRDSRQDLEDLGGVVTRDISAMVAPSGWDIASWAAKPFAILLSSFREAIFIDADSFFFVNPEVMFEYPEYVRTGALFFRDRLIMPENKKSWLQTVLPQPVSRNVKHSRLWQGTSGHQQESGVMVVDTYRHFLAMLFVSRMNGPDRDGDREKGRVGVYDMVYGDKETFWLGFELIGDTDYVFHEGDAGIIGVLQSPPPKPTRRRRLGKRDEGNDDDDDPEHDHHDEETPDGLPSSSLSSSSSPTPTADANATDEADLPGGGAEGRSTEKICSPQLLHLDLEGRPLWFNGGLVRNKFLDRREWRFGEWDTYLVEPREIREPGAWFLGEANMCCLTSDRHLRHELSAQHRALMDEMVAQARKVGIAT